MTPEQDDAQEWACASCGKPIAVKDDCASLTTGWRETEDDYEEARAWFLLCTGCARRAIALLKLE